MLRSEAKLLSPAPFSMSLSPTSQSNNKYQFSLTSKSNESSSSVCVVLAETQTARVLSPAHTHARPRIRPMQFLHALQENLQHPHRTNIIRHAKLQCLGTLQRQSGAHACHAFVALRLRQRPDGYIQHELACRTHYLHCAFESSRACSRRRQHPHVQQPIHSMRVLTTSEILWLRCGWRRNSCARSDAKMYGVGDPCPHMWSAGMGDKSGG